jgi:cyclic-di-GMP-binding protein
VKTAGLVFTLPEIHFFLSGGKIFEQPDRSREMTREEKQDMEVFGRVSERTQNKMVAEHNFSVEPWTVMEEMPGTWRVQRPNTASKGVAIGRLAGVRLGDSGGFYLGVIRALSHETDNRIIATIALFPGKPEPIAVRAGGNRTNAQWMQGFRLPALERLQIPESLLVPAAMALRGRALETWRESAGESTVREILEHGADFDRITVA